MRAAIAIGLAALMAQAALLATPAFAATIVVSTTADEKPGVDAPDGDCSLREAIASAKDDISYDACTAGSGPDTVAVPAGTYNIIPSHGEIRVDDSQVTSDGAGEGSTIVDGAAARTVFWTIGSPAIRIQDLTVRNGLNTVGAGGVMNLGTLTLDHVTVTGNDSGSGGLGGGVANLHLLTVTNSTVTGNTGTGIHDQGTLTLTDSTVSSNTASSTGAGGVETHDATIIGTTISGNQGNGIYALGPIDVTDTTISGQVAGSGAFGGGISILIGSGAVTSSLDRVRITGNGAPGGGGGGISDLTTSNAASNLTITDSTISGNYAPTGGGITSDPGSGTTTVERSTISGNTATSEYGGGIINSGALNLTNATVSGNDAVANGAGIVNFEGPLTVRSSTIADNASSTGTGGIQGVGPISMGNSIVADNTGGPGSGDDCFAPLTSAGYNLIETFDPGQCVITGDTTGNIIATDPGLGPLQDNGGPTFTQALPMDSPAVDQGNSFGKRVDQRGTGLPRPMDFTAIPNAPGGDGSDIGAFEVQPSPPDQPPVILLIGDRSIQEGQPLAFTVSATDADLDALVYSASNLPGGATFNPGTHEFSWVPSASQVGSYPNLRFEVSDGVLSDVENITVTVTSTPAPTPAPPTDQLAAAITKCKKKYKGAAHKKQRKRCIKKARKRFGQG